MRQLFCFAPFPLPLTHHVRGALFISCEVLIPTKLALWRARMTFFGVFLTAASACPLVWCWAHIFTMSYSAALVAHVYLFAIKLTLDEGVSIPDIVGNLA